MREVFVTLMLLCAAGCSAEPIQRSAEPVHERDRQVEETPLMTWADLLARPKATPTYEFDVGPASANVAELWLPEGDGPHPVVIMIHGGCWQKQIADRTLMHYAAEAMRREGFAVWNIEYRGVDEEGGGYPGTFRDVAIAADAVETVARDHNLDLSNLVAYGHSGGRTFGGVACCATQSAGGESAGVKFINSSGRSCQFRGIGGPGNFSAGDAAVLSLGHS